MTGESSSIDSTRPSVALVYDYLLGGNDNYAVDREIGDVVNVRGTFGRGRWRPEPVGDPYLRGVSGS